jgi:hypothetical protein
MSKVALWWVGLRTELGLEPFSDDLLRGGYGMEFKFAVCVCAVARLSQVTCKYLQVLLLRLHHVAGCDAVAAAPSAGSMASLYFQLPIVGTRQRAAKRC